MPVTYSADLPSKITVTTNIKFNFLFSAQYTDQLYTELLYQYSFNKERETCHMKGLTSFP